MGKSFGKKSQREPSFTQKITKLFWDTKQFDWGLGLNLTLEREGSKYPQWYAAGNADGLKFNKEKTEIVSAFPPDWALSTTSEAARMLNTLIDACDVAKVNYKDDNLKSFWGITCVWVNEEFKRRKGETRNIPVVKSVVLAGVGDKEEEDKNEETSAPDTMLETAIRMVSELEEVDLDAIDSKMLKKYTNGADYATRNQLAKVLSTPEFYTRHPKQFVVQNNMVSLVS